MTDASREPSDRHVAPIALPSAVYRITYGVVLVGTWTAHLTHADGSPPPPDAAAIGMTAAVWTIGALLVLGAWTRGTALIAAVSTLAVAIAVDPGATQGLARAEWAALGFGAIAVLGLPTHRALSLDRLVDRGRLAVRGFTAQELDRHQPYATRRVPRTALLVLAVIGSAALAASTAAVPVVGPLLPAGDAAALSTGASPWWYVALSLAAVVGGGGERLTRGIARRFWAPEDAPPVRVFFDATCGFCARAMGIVSGLDARKCMVWESLQSVKADGDPAVAGISPARLRETIHGTAADGRLVTGVDVYRAVFRAMVWPAPLAWLIAFPPTRPLAVAAYELVRRNR